jgi:DNA helicase-2/ATP-dependent DNA helicase PcrA
VTEDPLAFLDDSPAVSTTIPDETDEDVVAMPPTRRPATTLAREPNAQQREAIEAPVDAAVRVLAGPGSGKTAVIAWRYAYLLAHGATPDHILAVTFSHTMADELLARIKRVNPLVEGTAAERQVCTIHAICYRILKAEGDRRDVVKTWMLKKWTQEIAEDLWPYSQERPGWTEIMAWIDSAKMLGLTSAEDLEFLSNAQNNVTHRSEGERLHQVRRELDARMRRENVLTFADMLLDVETLLQRDRTFREKWQMQFKWVIVDEAQDVSEQALRILITLSFDPPANPVYNR